MSRIVIGKVSSFSDPGRKVVEVGEAEVGVFCVNGVFVAYENVCPHMGGPIFQSKIIGRVRRLLAAHRWHWNNARTARFQSRGEEVIENATRLSVMTVPVRLTMKAR